MTGGWWHNGIRFWQPEALATARDLVEILEVGSRAALWEDGLTRWERLQELAEPAVSRRDRIAA